MNKILKRVLTGLSVGAFVIGLFLYCPLRAILPIVFVLSTLVQIEFYQLIRKYEPATMFGVVVGALWIIAVGLIGFGRGLLVLASCAPFLIALATFALCVYVMYSKKYTRPISTIATTLAGFFYVPFALSFLLLIIQLTGDGFWGGAPTVPWTRRGLYLVFTLVALAKFSDTGGFAFGLSFGKHKMCPNISPNKSWEGLLGSIVFAMATAAMAFALMNHFGWWNSTFKSLTYPVVLAFGAVTAIVATLGDLIESCIKRECGVKDSATFMPAGMGGFLDMLDSILFLPVLFYPIAIMLFV